MSTSESQPLLSVQRGQPATSEDTDEPEPAGFKGVVARRLESNTVHWAVIALTVLDACFVISDLAWTLLRDTSCVCDNSCPEEPVFLGVFEILSIVITSLFLIEIPLTLYAFGHRHYTSAPHAYLHLFDAIVITATFTLEVFLKGREAEIAGLLVLLRLWRIVKLVTTVSVGATEINDVESPSVLAAHKAQWAKEKQHLLDELAKVKVELDKATILANSMS